MERGFTLLELLGIIILLGVIILVAVPSLTQTNKNAETNKERDFNNIINSACLSYIHVHTEEYEDLLNNDNTTKQINISELINEGYLKSSLKNPSNTSNKNTIEDENGILTVKNTSGQITCTYSK